MALGGLCHFYVVPRTHSFCCFGSCGRDSFSIGHGMPLFPVNARLHPQTCLPIETHTNHHPRLLPLSPAFPSAWLYFIEDNNSLPRLSLPSGLSGCVRPAESHFPCVCPLPKHLVHRTPLKQGPSDTASLPPPTMPMGGWTCPCV